MPLSVVERVGRRHSLVGGVAVHADNRAMGAFTVKIKCLSLNPSLSGNFLGDEGLLQLFQCLPKLRMLRSLK